jgi:tetratricopeptide (TPR) repeat protein
MTPSLIVLIVCAAQSNPPTARDIEAIQASLTADLRGTEDAQALPSVQRTTNLPTGAVSAGQLRHRPPRKAQQAVSRGARLSQAGRHDEAAREFEKAIESDPDYANAYDRLGVEYAQIGRYIDAEVQLTRAITLDPASWAAHYDLAVVLYNSGNLSGAERSVRRAMELSPAGAQPQMLLGLLLWSHEETRKDGLARLQDAARTLPEAKQLLKSLQGP